MEIKNTAEYRKRPRIHLGPSGDYIHENKTVQVFFNFN